MFSIDKEFQCAYGHRIHNQKLNSLFSISGTCKCRRLHGHQMLLKIGLQADELHNGMVTDFNHLAWVKEIVDDVIDHRFLMDEHDPMLKMLFPEVETFRDCLVDHGWYKMFDVDRLASKLGAVDEIRDIVIEKCSSLVLLDFLPTSENLCKWFFDIACSKMQEFSDAEGFRVAYVEFWETPKSHCRYDAK